MSEAYMLDTNICIYAMKKNAHVLRNMLSKRPTQIHISVITEAELRFGAAKSATPEKTLTALEHFLAPLQVVAFTAAETATYASVRAALERKGLPIGPLDTLIAAHAVARSMTLVTHNLGGFQRVPGLTVEDWSIDALA